MPIRISGIRDTLRSLRRDTAREIVRDWLAAGRRALDVMRQNTPSAPPTPRWLGYGRAHESSPTKTPAQSWEVEQPSPRTARTIVEQQMETRGYVRFAGDPELRRLQQRLYNDSAVFQPGNAFSETWLRNRVITEAFDVSSELGRRALRWYGC